ncbi:hypothetical protein F2Q69_00030256 [Brassica cretica]|uniref:Uncharacterized protein n=1 Tax=Brassica cretica TaxID=69181 RepID=A0A8S9RTQ5_BRACR|nr:hypothetical protein F2Q69_00030256 [Brassica cretica]
MPHTPCLIEQRYVEQIRIFLPGKAHTLSLVPNRLGPHYFSYIIAHETLSCSPPSSLPKLIAQTHSLSSSPKLIAHELFLSSHRLASSPDLIA